MNSRERLISAISRRETDRLPVTTHHVMPYFLEKYMGSITNQEFFSYFELDPINWVMASRCSTEKGEYFDPAHTELGFLETRRICSDTWKIEIVNLPDEQNSRQLFKIRTPGKILSMELQSNNYTTWVKEHLIKEKSDIDIIAKYMTYPLCDIDYVNKAATEYGDKGIIRGHISVFDGFGQPGCWQDAACLYGTEKLIMATFEDPQWVHEFLKILQHRKYIYIQSLKGARYDILELGGGDASTTVISPDIFNEFVAPYDAFLIDAAHSSGQKIVYHTCGGMMPILEDIAAMKPDAMETFTPSGMGGDTLLGEAKKRIGDKVCMIGGFDQYHFFKDCSEHATRKEVRRCFEAAGGGGGFILSPSDHFFDADINLLKAFADEAARCYYK
jgi:uroporphyrinogen decarboxylase